MGKATNRLPKQESFQWPCYLHQETPLSSMFLFVVVILGSSHTVPGQCGQSSYLCEHEEGRIRDVNKQ